MLVDKMLLVITFEIMVIRASEYTQPRLQIRVERLSELLQIEIAVNFNRYAGAIRKVHVLIQDHGTIFDVTSHCHKLISVYKEYTPPLPKE
jgi:hypothetical protein